MTTVLAIISAIIFFNRSIWWAFAVVVLFGLVQFATKSTMNAQAKGAMSYMPPGAAINSISNNVTAVNMLSTFVVWGLTIYALIAKFA